MVASLRDIAMEEGSASHEADLSGRQIGAYHVLRRLGRGGMADVYLAEQPSLNRQVALKVLKSSLASDEAYVRRFRNEAHAVAKLSHANIVQIFDISCIDGIHFIAQEYVKGQNLRQLLARQSSIDARLGMHIIRQVGAALHRAGQQGIIHRDIKPENIMLTPDGEVKVTDFGLARVVQNGDMNLTQIGVTMGTPLYMSPEQVEGKSLDQRSDLYSLGVTSYHMLAGKPPFTGDTPLSIAVQHLKNDPEPLETIRPDLPPALCRVVHKLMAKSPPERFDSALMLLRELRTLQPVGEDDDWSDSFAAIELEISGREYTPLAATQQLQVLMERTMALRVRRRVWHIALAVLLGAVLVGGAVAWIKRPQPLLAGVSGAGSQVPRRDSARSQYLFAMMTTSQDPRLLEARYRAVWEYFPPSASKENQYYVYLAKRRLARLYREERQYDQAIELYQELSEEEELEYSAMGHIGLANIYAVTNKDEGKAATKQLELAAPLIYRLPEPRREDLLRLVDKSLQEELYDYLDEFEEFSS